MYSILNITPHLGGGVGTVLLNLFVNDKANNHSVITLDYANEKAIDICHKNNIALMSQPNHAEILNQIEKHDIIIFHIWNHPLLYDFLIRKPLPKARIIFYLHTAGLHLPYVFPEKLLDYPDICVVSTPLTYESEEYKNFENKDKFRLIWATGGNQQLKNIQKTPHETFNIGYVGTVDHFRLHKDIIEVFKKTDILNANFILCGGPKEEYFNNLIEQENLTSKVIFTGEINDIKPYLSKFDIFAYMLSTTHCGSCDQALQEAMMAGVVPVVMNNPMECTMVEHNKTGLIANNTDEYIEYLELLYKDNNLRQRLSKNTQEYARKNFEIANSINKWNKIFNEIIKHKKTSKSWNIDKEEITSYDIFMESLGKKAELFVNNTKENVIKLLKDPNWQSDNKGTPKQYYKFLNGSKLKELVDLYE